MQKIKFNDLEPQILKKTFQIGDNEIEIEGYELDEFSLRSARDILHIKCDTETLKALEIDQETEEITEDQKELINKYNLEWEKKHKEYIFHILENYTNISIDQIPYLFNRIGTIEVLKFVKEVLELGRLDDTEKK